MCSMEAKKEKTIDMLDKELSAQIQASPYMVFLCGPSAAEKKNPPLNSEYA